jgi:hypothetical protein
MPEMSNRKAWLEARLVQVADFIKRDTARLEASPGQLSIKLSLDSWRNQHAELIASLDHEAAEAKRTRESENELRTDA